MRQNANIIKRINKPHYMVKRQREHKIYAGENKDKIIKCNYNPTNEYNEFYLTCTPWIDFVSLTHPIPDDKSSQSIPRICWGKYVEENGTYNITLKINTFYNFIHKSTKIFFFFILN